MLQRRGGDLRVGKAMVSINNNNREYPEYGKHKRIYD